jgi:hypothetical protein
MPKSLSELYLIALLDRLGILASQRFALPALGRGRRSRPARKMIRRVKLLEMCAESPASGARFVRPRHCLRRLCLNIVRRRICILLRNDNFEADRKLQKTR